MSRRIVIVGAGPGGLASAMLLARTGADVTVVERLDRVGGRSSTIEAEGGYRFDMGPTFFLYPRVLERIFAACGKDLSREVDLIRLDPQYHLVFEAGGELRASPDLATMAEQVAKLSPADAANLPRFMSDNRRKLAAFRPVLEKAFDSALDLVDPALLKSLPLMRPHQTVEQDLARLLRGPAGPAGLLVPDQIPRHVAVPLPEPVHDPVLPGIRARRLPPASAAAARSRRRWRGSRDELGVEIRLDAPVERDPASRAGRRSGSAPRPASHQRPMRWWSTPTSPSDDRGWCPNAAAAPLDRTGRSPRQEILLLDLHALSRRSRGTLPDLAHHTHPTWPRTTVRNITEIEDGLELPDEPSFYVQNACVDRSRAWRRPAIAPSTSWCRCRTCGMPRTGLDWQRESAALPAAGRSTGCEQLGLTDIENAHPLRDSMVTPREWRGRVCRWAIAARPSTSRTLLGQMLRFRPRNRFEDLEGVYLVGGGTHPGSGLPVIYEGARITSRLLARSTWGCRDGAAGGPATLNWLPANQALVAERRIMRETGHDLACGGSRRRARRAGGGLHAGGARPPGRRCSRRTPGSAARRRC